MREEAAARAGPGRQGPESAAAGRKTAGARATRLGAQTCPRGDEGAVELALAETEEGPRGVRGARTDAPPPPPTPCLGASRPGPKTSW